MLLPLLYIVIVMNKDRFRLNLIAEMIASAGFVFAVPLYEVWAVENMKGFGDPAFSRFSSVLNGINSVLYAEAAAGKMTVSHYFTEILTSLFVLGLAAIAVLNHPYLKKKINCHEYCSSVDFPLLWIRSLIPLGFVLMRLIVVV